MKITKSQTSDDKIFERGISMSSVELNQNFFSRDSTEFKNSTENVRTFSDHPHDNQLSLDVNEDWKRR